MPTHFISYVLASRNETYYPLSRPEDKLSRA